MTHDVIIIGSGAGGAAAAYVLAHAGLDVLLLERGPVLPRDGSPAERCSQLRLYFANTSGHAAGSPDFTDLGTTHGSQDHLPVPAARLAVFPGGP